MKNQTGKYLKYAIGEIVLVVIGILIALQINNWNENRKQNEKTKNLLVRLLTETINNQKTMTVDLEVYNTIIDNNTRFLNLFGNNVEKTKTTRLDSLFLNSALDFNVIINLNTLKEGMDNGEVSTIKNEALRGRLYNLNSFKDYLKEREHMINRDNNNFLVPFLYKNANLRNIHSSYFASLYKEAESSKMDNTNYNFLLNNREFENLMNSRFIYTKEMTILVKRLKNILDKLEKQLEEELKKYE
ncbi:MAG: hypothetical protein JXQ93_02870 [Flavobacteriaceae bacterium]